VGEYSIYGQAKPKGDRPSADCSQELKLIDWVGNWSATDGGPGFAQHVFLCVIEHAVQIRYGKSRAIHPSANSIIITTRSSGRPRKWKQQNLTSTNELDCLFVFALGLRCGRGRTIPPNRECCCLPIPDLRNQSGNLSGV